MKTDGCWPYETGYKVWQNGNEIEGVGKDPGYFDKKSTEYKEEICFDPIDGCVVVQMLGTCVCIQSLYFISSFFRSLTLQHIYYLSK